MPALDLFAGGDILKCAACGRAPLQTEFDADTLITQCDCFNIVNAEMWLYVNKRLWNSLQKKQAKLYEQVRGKCIS